MTNENFESFMRGTFTKIEKLLIEKGGEYASTDDRLSHFKEAGQFLNVPSEQALMSMAAKHILSIQRLTKTGGTWEQWSEKLGDTIAYLILLWALVQEKYGNDTEAISRAKAMYETSRHGALPPGIGIW